MEPIEFQNPRMGVRVHTVNAVRMLVWEHDPSCAGEMLHHRLASMRFHGPGVLLFQADVSGMLLPDLRLHALTTGSTRSSTLQWPHDGGMSLAQRLSIKSTAGPGASALAGSLHLSSIHTLCLMFEGVSAAWLNVLAATPMPALRVIEVLGPASALEPGPWSQAPWWGQVRALSLSSVSVSSALAASLGQALGALEELTLQSAGLDRATLMDLLQGDWVRHVHALTIARNDLGAALTALCTAPFDALTSLALHREALTPEVFGELLDAPWAAHLEHLDIMNTSLGAAGVEALCVRADRLPALRSVWASGLQEEAREQLASFLARGDDDA